MSKIGQIERITQNRVIRLFQNELKYTYLGNWKERENNSNVEEELLRNYLETKTDYSEQLTKKAVYELKKLAGDQSDELYPSNMSVYSILRYGVKVKDIGEQTETVHLIDWQNLQNNTFYITEEVTVKGELRKRPDLVLYINGIAIAVIELKRGSISVSEGIRQNLDNQQNRFIKTFFNTIQLVLAGNDTQGLLYGTTLTPEKKYLKWKEENVTYQPEDNLLDKHILQFCQKERILEFIHDYILFDKGIKKLCRPNQYFGVKATQQFVKKHEGGIIWHTQGSGKSLTMVWLAKWIRENIQDARLLIITDRIELDEQIESVFHGVNENIKRTKSGRELIKLLNATSPWLICSLIHKFAGRDNDDLVEYIKELKRPKDFKPKGNIIVFVDECHRTQSGDLHKAMKEIIPDALFIGFTGTPLLKSDKKKSIEIFGRYIHTYKFDEAVKDGVILDLLYEARDVDQSLTDSNGIDEWFEVVTKGMNDLPKAELKKKWGTMQKVLSTKSRLEKIVFDIVKDFKIKPRLRNGMGNAMLVARSIYEACRFYELFQSIGFKKCAIVTSFEPNAYSTKGETTGEGDTDKIEQYEIYQKMLNGKDREMFEKSVIKQFKEEPANMQLLIVVDKLLTGFDAPACTYLYIDKQMRDHGLFQAICRVNRTDKEDKEFGYIIDYQNLFASGKITDAICDYTSGAFDNYDEKDVEGLLSDRLEKAKERLEDAFESLHQLCEPIASTEELEKYIHYFCGNTENPEDLKLNEDKRLEFYKITVALIRAYNNLAGEMIDAGYTQVQADEIKQKVKYYTELRNSIKNASGDYIDLKQYEPDMRQMLDMYLSADPSRMLCNFDNKSMLDIIIDQGVGVAQNKMPEGIKKNKRAMAETIENNMRKAIIQEMPINPAYYENMSVLLLELITQRKKEAITYEEYLNKIEQLAKNIHPKTSDNYPSNIDTNAKRAIYDNIDKNIELSVAMDKEILYLKKDNWVENTIKEREIKNIVKKYVKDHKKVDEIFDIIKNQREYR
ncbi:MAG: restriction endonuclease subunit R [Bacteroidetes bacterium GWE2_29_8]|nr:MAG: restriction endonuclease subunit R [Bacteroidetes bacterium GWE2_29_8]OFY18061.1 MAG: restriction endonuclease subunit R [Bacteroidetes bacterium GWF2_29_10]